MGLQDFYIMVSVTCIALLFTSTEVITEDGSGVKGLISFLVFVNSQCVRREGLKVPAWPITPQQFLGLRHYGDSGP